MTKYLPIVTSSITILAFLYAGYSQLATKDDLNRTVIISNFKWSESNIKINNLQLDNLDRIKLVRDLTISENRNYDSIKKSTERIVKAQEALLETQSTVN